MWTTFMNDTNMIRPMFSLIVYQMKSLSLHKLFLVDSCKFIEDIDGIFLSELPSGKVSTVTPKTTAFKQMQSYQAFGLFCWLLPLRTSHFQ